MLLKAQFLHIILSLKVMFIISFFVLQNYDYSFKDFHQKLISRGSSGLTLEGPKELNTSENHSKQIDRKQVFRKYANKNKIVSRFKILKSNKVTTKGSSSDKLILKYVEEDKLILKYVEGKELGDPTKCGNGPTCQHTFDRSKLKEASAVLVFLNMLPREPSKWIPLNYSPSDAQKWVSVTMESPQFFGKSGRIGYSDLHHLNGIFDYTASYRSDATFDHNYFGNCFWEKNNKTKTIDKNGIMKLKDKSVLWIVSHCETRSKREDYVESMSSFMNITIRGKCSKTQATEAAMDDIFQYYFYLSFENSLCDQYITEKFFKILSFDSFVVPVVMGAPKQDYERLAPPNSFIHISDFAGPKELAEYLTHLINNPEEYYRYLSWREEYEQNCKQRERDWICKICASLYKEPDPNHRQIQDFPRHWTNRSCYESDYTYQTIRKYP